METEEIASIDEEVRAEGAFLEPLRAEMGKVIVGQSYLVDRLIIGLLANGHVLLEGVPGLAKTLAVKTLSGRTDWGTSAWVSFLARWQLAQTILPVASRGLS